ncbi:hypothetical protein BZG36_04582 [Bifiguratus adelaidae]|uniref:GPI inositol-deacylase n=1 Tax=Bifiguratus adelaidae TaxID=1938954 RepID=A0A261XUY1_9FUNG|nr:hypothetical protein BZG36_04582 [Bifiguratus adelaidae]
MQRNLLEEDNLLVVFIHGFKGSVDSFEDFPNRLRTILTNSMNADVETLIYPTYQTRGSLEATVVTFCDWLEDGVKERQQHLSKIGSTGKVRIVLCGHSMGGIVGADVILRLHGLRHEVMENVLGLLAFDTPFYSLHSDVIAQTALQRVEGSLPISISDGYSIVSTVVPAANAVTAASPSLKNMFRRAASSVAANGRTWGTIAGVAGAATAVGVALSQRNKVTEGSTWVFEHMQFVSALIKDAELRKRIDDLIKVPDITFYCYYMKNTSGNTQTHRTFIRPPPSHVNRYFTPLYSNSNDEIDAHMEMFSASKNTDYYRMGTECMSKDVCLSHHNVVANLMQQHCVNGKWVDPKGAKWVFLKQFALDLFLASIEKYKLTHLPLVPLICLLLAKTPLVDNNDLSTVRRVASGAAPLVRDLELQLKHRFPETAVIQDTDSRKRQSRVTGYPTDLVWMIKSPAQWDELESYLLTHPDVIDAAAIPLYDPSQATELPLAFVVLREGAKSTPEDIRAFINGKVAPHKKLRGGVRVIVRFPRAHLAKFFEGY